MAFIISVLHNFVNIFMYILCSFAYFTQSPASSIVHLLYQNDTFSTYIVSFVYCFCLDFVHPGHTPSPALSPLLLPAAVLFCSKIPFPPQDDPARSCFMLRDVLSPQHENSGAHPGLPLSAASIFFLLTGPIQASRHPALVSSRHGPL